MPVRNIALPNLSLPMELGYQEQFSLFVPKHRRMAGKLIDVFMGKTSAFISNFRSAGSLLSPLIDEIQRDHEMVNGHMLAINK